MNYKKLLVAFGLFLILTVSSYGQVSLTNASPSNTIDFSSSMQSTVGNGAFTGAGFQASPTAGQLNSNAWAATGWTDGALAFGGTRTTAATDYTRGATASAVLTGGFYAFTSSPQSAANPCLMAQPGGSDFAPGTITLRIQNNGSVNITALAISYNLFVRNDQARSNSFNFSYSPDDATYTTVPALDYTSTAALDASGWVQVGTSPSRTTSITGLNITPGSFYYIRWSGADVGGSGSRDEFGLDDISITGTFVSSCTAPTTQASAIIFSSVTTTTMSVNWTNGNGAGRVVKMNTSNSFTAPTNGTLPSASLAWANAGEQVVFAGTGSGAINITGLSASTTYWYRVYEYCTTGNVYQTATATDNPLSQDTASAGVTSTANGDWNTGSTWIGGVVPTSAQNVIINHAVTLAAGVTRDAGTTTTISTSSSLATSVTYTNNGTTMVNGTFQLDTGGWATGSNFTYGATGTLVFNSTSNYGVNNGDVYWPTSNSPFNVTILQGGMTMNATTIRTVAGTFSIAGAGVTITAPSTLTLTGTCLINSGGFFNNSPIYGASSLLRYNTTGTYRRGFEWLANGVGIIGTTAGYPNNVQLSNNTTFDYNNGNPANKAMNGSLTIDAGSTFTMTDTTNGAPSAGTLTIGGSVTNNGTFTFADVATPIVVAGNYTNAGTTTMGSVSGADLRLAGDFSNTNTFNGNARAVFFTKTGTQIVTSSSTLTIPYVVTSGTGTTVQLAAGTNLIVSAPNGGNVVSFGDPADIININGNTVTLGTAATANVINGTGSFRGSATSNLTLLGTGSIGTLNFTTGFQNLGTFTMNRQAATVGCLLGTAVTINTSLVLTNGLIDLGANTMTLASTCSNTFTASGNSYVIADVTSGGVLSKAITATGTTYNFPIGDGTASADGAQYSPATVNFTAGSFTTAFLGVAVVDTKHPNMDATTHFISRYWAVTTSGTFTIPTYTFGGTYLPVDINGAETTSRGNQWDGTTWMNLWNIGSTGSNNLSLTNCTNVTAPNHFSAGLRDQEINIIDQATTITYSTGSTYPFGTATVGYPIDVTFAIQNLGQATLNLGVLSNAPAITGNPPYSLLTNYSPPSVGGMTSTTPNTRTFVIRFDPSSAGPFTGSVTIKSDDANEGAGYVINFTGTGVLPTPEINVKGVVGTNPSILSGDTIPDPLDNTQFVATNIGSSQAKIFRIQNIGSLGLNVSSITTSNTTDFTITSAAPYTNIPFTGTNYVDFTITFNPQNSGLRTSTISIAHDDATGGENPYTFAVEGNGVCTGMTTTVTPASGPVGTEVTITATTNNIAGASLTLSSTSQTVTQVSSTQIKFTVQSGAASGNLVITNSQGCSTSNVFTVLTTLATPCEGGYKPLDLFISEFTDANAGALSYVEIFNGTGVSKNLSNYSLQTANNGGTYAFTLNLSNVTLASGSTYVVALGNDNTCSASPGGNGSYAAQTSASGSVNFVASGNDHVALFNGATLIDSWGTFGSNSWASSLSIGTEGADFRRNTNVVAPNATYSNSDWTIIDYAGTGVCANNDYSNIGIYSLPSVTPPNVTTHPSYTPTCKATSLTVEGAEGYAGGYALAYQWYAVAPNTGAWTAITDGGLYSGATTATLNISDISTLIGYQFYSQVRENAATCYSASNAVMITAGQSTTWQAGNTWSNGTPDLDKAAIINNNYDTSINGDLEACSVTVNNGFTLLAQANDYVLIKNDLTVNAGGTATFENNSSLVQINNVANTGNITYKRIAQQRRLDYVYWSSPVNGFDLSSHPSNGYKFSWNTTLSNANGTQGNWQTASGVMNAGQGYIVSGPSTFNNTANQNLEVPFLGVPRNGDYDVTIYRGSYTGANYTLPAPSNATVTNLDDNWNLLGNPYPSAISCRGFLTNNNTPLTGALYIWTHGTLPSTSTSNPFYNTFFSNYNAATDYVPFNLTGNLANPNPDYYIGAGQGFFVTMKDGAAGSATVNFVNSLRDKTYVNATGTNFFKTSSVAPHTNIEGPDYNRIWIDLVKENRPPVRTMFGYVSGATMGRDNLHDAISKRDGTLKLYSIMNDESFVIQGRSLPFDENDQVAIGMDIIESGDYKIALAIVDGVFSNTSQNIYLEDKYLNIIYDLRLNPYSFSSVAGAFNDRFVIRYTNVALSNPDFETLESNVVLAANHGELTIKSLIENIQEVTVYDVLGRQLFFAKGISSTNFVTSAISASQQALIVKIKLENGVMVSRKVIL